MIVQCGDGQVRRCWACTIKKEVRSRLWVRSADGNSRVNLTAWDLYERAVEAIEAMRSRSGFRMVDVWHKAGGGPAQYSYARLAVLDMAAHGIVVPVTFRSDGKVELWQVKEEYR